MKTPRDLHIEASQFYSKAKKAQEENNIDLYKELLVHAYAKFIEATDILVNKFEAEPTRSVMFRSAASLAIQLNKVREAEILINKALLGNPPLEIANELRILYKKYVLSFINKPTYDTSYLMGLRENAIHILLSPNSLKYEHAVIINNISNFLSIIGKSWSNFIRINLVKDLSSTFIDESGAEVAASDLATRLPLISVDHSFSSFGISVACDHKVMINDRGLPGELKKWKNNIFERFKSEFFFNNLSDEQHILYLERRYEPLERKIIFSPFISLLNSPNHTISLTDQEFLTTSKTFLKISDKAKTRLLPPVEKISTEQEAELRRSYYIKKGDNSQKKIIQDERITRVDINWPLQQITTSLGSIYLKSALEINIHYEENIFSIEFDELAILLFKQDIEELRRLFQTEFLNLYIFLKRKNENELSIIEKDHKNFFLDWVAMDDIKMD